MKHDLQTTLVNSNVKIQDDGKEERVETLTSMNRVTSNHSKRAFSLESK
jgi:hypothetical protein